MEYRTVSMTVNSSARPVEPGGDGVTVMLTGVPMAWPEGRESRGGDE
jgi:hypothetical protein